ncbi:EF-hand domain-containing protein [Flavobacterium sp. LMO8]|uniref:EF-hand domain-containing protein n=1 Tax=unclassified Flavobacterium TaxID=196869 RepID=UPI001292581E|nr:EF-hand domain-containing protein [Flavobacterium sp. LMO8]MQP24233.1 EF-hand domain-containing protein [Flavobacterium sp. LMO8]
MKQIALLFGLFIISFSSCAQEKREERKVPTVDELFTQMDSNKDAKLSKKEVKGPLKDDFSKIDTNKDGFITKEELKKAPKPERKGPPKR